MVGCLGYFLLSNIEARKSRVILDRIKTNDEVRSDDLKK